MLWRIALVGLVFIVGLLLVIGFWARKKSTTQPGNTSTAGSTTPKKSGIGPYWALAKKTALIAAVLWFSWFLVMDVVLRMQHYIHTGPVRVTEEMATSTSGPRSEFFTGQTHFLNEVIKFCYFDTELGLSREEAWDCTDMVDAESNFQMYNNDGSVRRGDQNRDDVGIFMINVKHSVEEITEAGCSIDSFECQKKVFRLIFLKKRSFERWHGHAVVKTLKVKETKRVAPVGEWGESLELPKDKSCFVQPNRNLEMLGRDGIPMAISPDHVPFLESPTIRFRSTDEVEGEVLIKCR